MQRSLWIGLVVSCLAACGDDGGGGSGDSGSGSTSDASTTTNPDPTTEGPTTSTTESPTTGTTEPGTGSTSSGGSTSEATGTGSGSSGSSSSGSSGGGEFSVTSPDFTDGELLPFDAHICEGNVHPQLDWVNPPEGTMSFAVYFHDVSIDFEHSAIWDIPVDATGLPAGIEDEPMPPSVEGASQCQHWGQSAQLNPYLGPGPRFGYGGPGSCDNTYQFTVYALDVAALEEVDTDSDRFAVRTALEDHAIETVTISGQTRGSVCIQNCTPVPE